MNKYCINCGAEAKNYKQVTCNSCGEGIEEIRGKINYKPIHKTARFQKKEVVEEYYEEDLEDSYNVPVNSLNIRAIENSFRGDISSRHERKRSEGIPLKSLVNTSQGKIKKEQRPTIAKKAIDLMKEHSSSKQISIE